MDEEGKQVYSSSSPGAKGMMAVLISREESL